MSVASQSIFGQLKQSLVASAGDIVFGMEDGTVSIFGLVFGVAASSTSSAPVLLAGSTFPGEERIIAEYEHQKAEREGKERIAREKEEAKLEQERLAAETAIENVKPESSR